MTNAALLEALLLAEEFIAQELENRESGFVELDLGDTKDDYVQEARDVLTVVRKALGK